MELLQTPSEGDTPVHVPSVVAPPPPSGAVSPSGGPAPQPEVSGPKQTRYIADDYPSDEDAEGSSAVKRTDEASYW